VTAADLNDFVSLQQLVVVCVQIHRLDSKSAAQGLQTHGAETIGTATTVTQGTFDI